MKLLALWLIRLSAKLYEFSDKKKDGWEIIRLIVMNNGKSYMTSCHFSPSIRANKDVVNNQLCSSLDKILKEIDT